MPGAIGTKVAPNYSKVGPFSRKASAVGQNLFQMKSLLDENLIGGYEV